MKDPVPTTEKLTEPKFKQRLLARYFVRMHMSLILGAVCLSGVVSSKLLLLAGLGWMPIRSPVAVLAAYIHRLDEMVAREIIEPDPGRPGFRIRPEARRIVTETLYHHNLL